MNPILSFLLMLTLSAASSCDSNFRHRERVTEAVLRVLHEQTAAWNRGDLEGFVQGYAESDSLRFASGGNVSYGWQGLLARYRKSYPNRAAMGTLAFTELDVDVLTPDAALVFGRWQLQRPHDAPWGYFTLIFRRTEEGWRIVHDHTSAAR